MWNLTPLEMPSSMMNKVGNGLCGNFNDIYTDDVVDANNGNASILPQDNLFYGHQLDIVPANLVQQVDLSMGKTVYLKEQCEGQQPYNQHLGSLIYKRSPEVDEEVDELAIRPEEISSEKADQLCNSYFTGNAQLIALSIIVNQHPELAKDVEELEANLGNLKGSCDEDVQLMGEAYLEGILNFTYPRHSKHYSSLCRRSSHSDPKLEGVFISLSF
jgi:hypothetical protein